MIPWPVCNFPVRAFVLVDSFSIVNKAKKFLQFQINVLMIRKFGCTFDDEFVILMDRNEKHQDLRKYGLFFINTPLHPSLERGFVEFLRKSSVTKHLELRLIFCHFWQRYNW
jgi:hypothetical protein